MRLGITHNRCGRRDTLLVRGINKSQRLPGRAAASLRAARVRLLSGLAVMVVMMTVPPHTTGKVWLSILVALLARVKLKVGQRTVSPLDHSR